MEPPRNTTGFKKFVVIALTGIGSVSFVTVWTLGVYWSGSRRLPAPELGRVIEQTDRGHKYYLTLAESRLVSEPVFALTLLLVALAIFLDQLWAVDVFKRKSR
jgi:hypothetical protein